MGLWKSEITDPDEFIVEFVSVAPKSYAFKTNKGNQKIVLKGISLKQSGLSDALDFETVKAILLGKLDVLANFYDKLEDKELGIRLKQMSIELNKNFLKSNSILPGKNVKFILPDSKIRRNMDGTVYDSPDDNKVLQINFNKRQLRLPTLEQKTFLDAMKIYSTPWGYKYET